MYSSETTFLCGFLAGWKSVVNYFYFFDLL